MAREPDQDPKPSSHTRKALAAINLSRIELARHTLGRLPSEQLMRLARIANEILNERNEFWRTQAEAGLAALAAYISDGPAKDN